MPLPRGGAVLLGLLVLTVAPARVLSAPTEYAGTYAFYCPKGQCLDFATGASSFFAEHTKENCLDGDGRKTSPDRYSPLAARALPSYRTKITPEMYEPTSAAGWPLAPCCEDKPCANEALLRRVLDHGTAYFCPTGYCLGKRPSHYGISPFTPTHVFAACRSRADGTGESVEVYGYNPALGQGKGVAPAAPPLRRRAAARRALQGRPTGLWGDALGHSVEVTQESLFAAEKEGNCSSAGSAVTGFKCTKWVIARCCGDVPDAACHNQQLINRVYNGAWPEGGNAPLIMFLHPGDVYNFTEPAGVAGGDIGHIQPLLTKTDAGVVDDKDGDHMYSQPLSPGWAGEYETNDTFVAGYNANEAGADEAGAYMDQVHPMDEAELEVNFDLKPDLGSDPYRERDAAARGGGGDGRVGKPPIGPPKPLRQPA